MSKKFELAIVLEDEPVCREIVTSTASNLAKKVIVATSVIEARQIISEDDIPDLIISDCMLEDGSPVALVKALAAKARDKGKNCSVFYMSADPDPPITDYNCFLEKPFSEEELKKTVVRSTENGFTLVEVLAVVTIVALMFGATYGVITSLSAAKKNVEQAHKNLRTVQNFFTRVNKEISTAQKLPIPESEGLFMQLNGGSGLGGENDGLAFTTSSGAIDTGTENANFGLIEVRYFLRESEKDDRFNLVRTELPGGIIDDRTRSALNEKRKLKVILAKNVVDLNFRFFHDNEWKSSWREKNKLPQAVEIAISLISDSGNVEMWKTSVALLDDKKN